MKLPKHLIDAIGADPANCVTPSDETPRLDRAAVKAQRADSNGSKSAGPPPKRVLTVLFLPEQAALFQRAADWLMPIAFTDRFVLDVRMRDADS